MTAYKMSDSSSLLASMIFIGAGYFCSQVICGINRILEVEIELLLLPI
jgi:hypothetical protein